jgi:hypothetical protein
MVMNMVLKISSSEIDIVTIWTHWLRCWMVRWVKPLWVHIRDNWDIELLNEWVIIDLLLIVLRIGHLS